MTTIQKQHVQMPRHFSQEELDTLIVKAEEQYRNSLQACYRLNKPLFPLFLEEAIRLVGEGYSLHSTLPASCGPGSYNTWLIKPEALQAADLEQIRLEVKEKYEQSIDAHNKANTELLASQLYEAEKKKAEEAERKRDEKAKAKALDEAQTYFNNLIKESK